MNQQTDVAQSSLSSKQLKGPLKWVGMENMRAPLKGILNYPVEARISALVSLAKDDQRGIHMSRIFEIVRRLSETQLKRSDLSRVLNEMIDSQKGSSDAAKVVIHATPLFERKALLSDKVGFKSYPVQIKALRRGKKEQIFLQVIVEYSSTCPCSAALAREAIADGFKRHFAGGGLSLESAERFLLDEGTWAAWPHAQRSRAYGLFLLDDGAELPAIANVIDQMEKALATPTQTAVKRIDEQEFARLNAQNLMFCEDAVRRLKAAFQKSPYKDFKFSVRHFESLHSHDVYAEARK